MGEPMTEAEARERLVEHVAARIEQTSVTEDACFAVAAILATTDALAVLLDPETMLRAWEKAGRVESPGWWFVGPQDDLGTDNPYERFAWVGDVTDEEPLNPAFADRCVPLWRIVPDEEGARDG